MQHQYWITKQTLSRKLGRKEDECIVSSDAQLDAKLELFRNIQMSCTLIQRIIDKYQESICYLSQEINSMGKFLKENTDEDKSRTGDIMLTIGKSLIFCAQQHLILHEPLIRFYHELETFRQRAVGDTLHNVLAMEKARTEYRAALSWMKNISQQLNPDTIKQLEKFKRVQHQVRRGKFNFDKQSLDCLQKIDLLAAARCNMFNYALSLYQNKLMNYIEKTARTFSTISASFEHQSKISDKIDIKRLKKNELDSKEDKHINQNSEFLKDKASLINNSSIGTSMFDEFTTENIKCNQMDVSNIQDSLLRFCDWEIPNSSRHSYTQEQSIELENVSISKYKNKYNEVSNTEVLKGEDIYEKNYNTEDESNFLPSAFLKQSLETALNKSKSSENNFLTDKNNVNKHMLLQMDCLKNSDNTKSWMNLFEDLDPLSSNLNEKLTKYKSPFV
ncbi:PREDICTED: islet cell autoantigen 1 [Ceratosolen solmsi marchali]|uniref:Islet cell autoantigen 1 n=1 Tax=Ceratosolen solmsi marchali TaxID=326594 RepID=A0AAJ7DYY2_9HYME|nr:PREDICTED: islet cell autoantigen 1 [Ceratosolen solmsi marchali]